MVSGMVTTPRWIETGNGYIKGYRSATPLFDMVVLMCSPRTRASNNRMDLSMPYPKTAGSGPLLVSSRLGDSHIRGGASPQSQEEVTGSSAAGPPVAAHMRCPIPFMSTGDGWACSSSLVSRVIPQMKTEIRCRVTSRCQ